MRSLRRRLGVLVDPKRRYNCADQGNAKWDQRAEVAVELIGARRDVWEREDQSTLRIADFGCGNERLRAFLERSAAGPFTYEGYDLHPQSSRVRKVDLNEKVPSEGFDVVFCLGLLEYLPDLKKFLQRLTGACRAAVVSYVTTDPEDSLRSSERRIRGWLTDHKASEMVELFQLAGFLVDSSSLTPDGRTTVWLLRSSADQLEEKLL